MMKDDTLDVLYVLVVVMKDRERADACPSMLLPVHALYFNIMYF